MRSILVYTVHKAASTFLHRLARDICKELDLAYYSINNNAYFDEIKQGSWKVFIEEKADPGCFCPIRAGAADPSFPEDLASYAVVLHLRDPRDVLVSLFFSHTYNHSRKPGRFDPSDAQRKGWEEGGIDTFVLEQAPEFKRRYQELTATLLGKEKVIFLRYEDMVGDYATWLTQFLSAFAHLPGPSKRVLKVFDHPASLARLHKRLYRKYKKAFVPSSEDIYKHKRQITPGDHKRKLKATTIERLDLEFSDLLKRLGYE